MKASQAAAGDQEAGDDGEEAGEEECSAEFKPVVQLEEVEVSTGEEDEDALFDACVGGALCVCARRVEGTHPQLLVDCSPL